ncbi:MAG: D-sedoheptulose 7-phosphate isomerase [Rhodospirillales bacterium]
MSVIRDEVVRHREVVERVLDGLIDQIEEASQMVADGLRAGGKLLVFGNGGSAGDAQHIAAELVGRYLANNRRPLPAIALTTDTSALTAIANDFSFASVFERQVQALAGPRDVAIGISTSGESENVLLGLRAAQAAGARTIALLGRSGGRIAAACDLPLIVPSAETPRIQEMHILIGHLICAYVDAAFAEG